MVSKSELINEVAEAVGVTKKDTKAVIEAFWKKVIEHVKVGSEVQFIGIGKFTKVHREARVGRNPQTGEEMQIKAVDKLGFKSSLKF